MVFCASVEIQPPIHGKHKFQMSIEMDEVESGSGPAHRPQL